MVENSVKPSIAAARFTTSRTVNLVDLLTRSARVPRSGLASIAITRSSRESDRAIPSRVVTVVFPTPPLRVSTGTNLAPPSNTAPIRASRALRSRTLRESPRLMVLSEIRYRKRRNPASGDGRFRGPTSIRRSAVSIAAGSGWSNRSPRN
ncbi:unannotated protein [freshwater metagenome]|uniref:Unannotated protein n=1 Tax=freshwater metagenome TaxID=449393 RepID=A0A6J6GSA6_9ZZZZ